MLNVQINNLSNFATRIQRKFILKKMFEIIRQEFEANRISDCIEEKKIFISVTLIFYRIAADDYSAQEDECDHGLISNALGIF